MTTIEKINLLNSKSPAIPRLHIPYYAWWSEAAHGVAWAGTATVFPCSMALGATFDPLLVEAAGLAISNEARAKHLHHLNKTTHASELFFGLDFFAPNINIVRDIRWGRAQETYSEDPLLVGTLGAAVIKGMQQYDTKRQRYKTIATAKHFASYNVESNFAVGGTNGQYRLMYDVNVSHADLMQTFFPAFEDAIVHGGAGSIMCSYNRLNSYPMCASPYLKSIVRDRFKFPSYIVSDSGAVVSDLFVFLLYSRIYTYLPSNNNNRLCGSLLLNPFIHSFSYLFYILFLLTLLYYSPILVFVFTYYSCLPYFTTHLILRSLAYEHCQHNI